MLLTVLTKNINDLYISLQTQTNTQSSFHVRTSMLLLKVYEKILISYVSYSSIYICWRYHIDTLTAFQVSIYMAKLIVYMTNVYGRHCYV